MQSLWKYNKNGLNYAFAKANLINIILQLIVNKYQQLFSPLKRLKNPSFNLYFKFMKKLLLLVVLLSLYSCNNGTKQAEKIDNQGITTFYFIRHAEKRTDQGSDPELTPAGEKRADAWVNYFFLKNIDHIISSDFKRTLATAAPLAKAHNMDVEIYDVKTAKGIDLLKKYRGKTVALFGHSNTINAYTNELQTDSIYNALDDKDYDSYFFVRVSESGKSSGVKESMDFMEE